MVTVYSENCVTLDSWTEFVLTSTKTEKAHLKINITTNSIPRLSLQHLQISPLVFTVLALPFKHFSLRPLVGKCVGVK